MLDERKAYEHYAELWQKGSKLWRKSIYKLSVKFKYETCYGWEHITLNMIQFVIAPESTCNIILHDKNATHLCGRYIIWLRAVYYYATKIY